MSDITKRAEETFEVARQTIAKGIDLASWVMIITTADRLGLDVFARQISPVKRSVKNKDTQRYEDRWQALTTIDGSRSIAERSGKYAGQLGPFWCGPDGVWVDVWLAKEPPKAAKVGVLRHDFKEPLWAVALYDAYVQTYNNKPTGRWAEDPAGMLAKCAESLALRRGFPHLLSGVYTVEEMKMLEEKPDDDSTSAVESFLDKGGATVTVAGEPHDVVVTELECPPAEPSGHQDDATAKKDTATAEKEKAPENGAEAVLAKPTTLEEAKAIQNRHGQPYGDIDTATLSHMHREMLKLYKQGGENIGLYEAKIKAIEMIIPARHAEEKKEQAAKKKAAKDKGQAKSTREEQVMEQLGFPPENED